MGQYYSASVDINSNEADDDHVTKHLLTSIFDPSRKRKLVESVVLSHLVKRQISRVDLEMAEIAEEELLTSTEEPLDWRRVELQRLRILMTSANGSGRPKLRWNAKDCSRNMRVSQEDNTCVERLPVRQSTDGVRTSRGWSKGLHAWTINWSVDHRGSHACVGVATQKMPLELRNYSNLLGDDENSWGVDLVRNEAVHNRNNRSTNNPNINSINNRNDSDNDSNRNEDDTNDNIAPPCLPPFPSNNVTLVLDCDAATLHLLNDDGRTVKLFDNLPRRRFYPCVVAVSGNCRIKIKHLGSLPAGPCNLSSICNDVILRSIGIHRVKYISHLPLPSILINNLTVLSNIRQ